MFNRNNLKTSYSCMSNMAALISSHKARVLAPVPDNAPCHAIADSPANAPSMETAWLNSSCTMPQSQCHISLTNTTTVWQRARSKCASMVTPTHSVQRVAEGKLSCPSTSGSLRTKPSIWHQLEQSEGCSSVHVWHTEMWYLPYREDSDSWPIINPEHTGRNRIYLPASC